MRPRITQIKLIEKVEKKNAAENTEARHLSDVKQSSGDSRRGSALGLAAMLMKNDHQRQSSRQF
jgi:hypothetical protein